MNTQHIFVYGLLQSKFNNKAAQMLRKHATLIGAASIPGAVFDLGDYPVAIFDKKMNKEGALAGMIVGIVFTTIYIFYFKPQLGGPGLPENYLFGITPEGIGTIGMVINFIVSLIVSRVTKPTPNKIKHLVESIRYPK